MKNFRGLAALLLASALLTGGAAAQTPGAYPAQDDLVATAKGNVAIHPIGHASVLLRWNGKTILVDPAPSGGGGGGRGAAGGRNAGPPPPSPDALAVFTSLGTPDLIVISHAHGDHFNAAVLSAVAGPSTVLAVPQVVYDGLPDALKAKATIMANGDKSVLAGIDVTAVPAYNITPERLRNHPQGVGNGYVLTLGGKRFYFAGDTEETPELKNLAGIDVAFLPMNLPYTQTPEAAAQWVKDFKPKIVYPYHYSNADLTGFVQGVGAASDVRLRKWY